MKINAIFCNPNKQGFILDKHLLENTNIKLINTASTGITTYVYQTVKIASRYYL